MSNGLIAPTEISLSAKKIHFHTLEISSESFKDININFYPGFAEKNAFLGHFKSTRKRQKRQIHNNGRENSQSKSTVIMIDHDDTFENTRRALSNIPVASRLRFINFTDCEDMLYSNIMRLLSSELSNYPANIILKFEDMRNIQQK